MNATKRNSTKLAALLGILTLSWGVFPDAARAQGQATELGAMILTADGQRQRGFVQNSNENGLLFTLVQGAPGTGYRWGDQVVAVAFDDADEIMREARASYTQGNLETAAEQFGRIADIYVIAGWAPNNFAAEARYYQIESLRRLGRWTELAALFETPTGLAIPKVLSEFYQPQFKLNRTWASLGAGEMDPVKAEVEARQVPQTGQAKLLPSPAFQAMPLRELVQITFMRAKLNEAAEQPAQALEDYYRTFTLTYANDKTMADLSMNAAMAIQAKNPAFQEEEIKNTPALRQMQSLAYLYKHAFGGGEIDPAFSSFAVRPELPKPPAPKPEEGGEAAPADAAGDAKAGDDQPAAADDKGNGGDQADDKKAAAPAGN